MTRIVFCKKYKQKSYLVCLCPLFLAQLDSIFLKTSQKKHGKSGKPIKRC